MQQPDRSSWWSLAEDDISHFVWTASRNSITLFPKPEVPGLAHRKSSLVLTTFQVLLPPPHLIAASAISGRVLTFQKEAQSQAKHQRCSIRGATFRCLATTRLVGGESNSVPWSDIGWLAHFDR